MSKSPKDHLTEAKRIAARLLATPPEPHKAKKGADKDKPRRRLPASDQEINKNRNRPKARG